MTPRPSTGFIRLITSEQIKAARMLLGWDQPKLAQHAGVGVATIRRIESVRGPVQGSEGSVAKVKAAIEKAGVRFIATTQYGGEGVRKTSKTTKSHQP